MKKFKIGFTMSEVLVALGIVGVIAAIVIPQLVTSTQKDVAGATLGRAVEQFELGCQNMIQAYNDTVNDGSYADTLAGISNFSMSDLAPYIGATYRNPTPSIPGGNAMPAQWSLYEFNKFPADIQVSNNAVSIPDNPADDEVIIEELVIDVTGYYKKPNKDGRDRFYFRLRNNGKLEPYGVETYKTTCADGNITDAKTCTARVIADGFKIKY